MMVLCQFFRHDMSPTQLRHDVPEHAFILVCGLVYEGRIWTTLAQLNSVFLVLLLS